MNILGVVLLLISGGSGLLAISVLQRTPDAGIAHFLGAFAIPALLGWWGVIALKKNTSKSADPETPNPATHVRCPECRELIRADAKLCKHCGTRLSPIEP